ncbi:hypothetical protein SIL04_10050 [Bacillus cereus group sp. BfR-BA-00331]|uniref:hypothetical protein n=1 Tax=Bacillus cereus group TaxID=86661 RepID=UPI0007724F7D|nr:MULTISPECIES: hypothetical protein [Bacillus cereus group]ONG70136.1 hypothetical protein BKK44_14040 [Bacillus cereus]MDA2192077.1 hypothetical protein [Bacillus cereus group sp. Bc238]MDA2197582.1 hypothetical protein [Bacillus cereus group sp. Bc237]MDA2756294.1 hypothetical protein [Bacillus cereus group sp. Bc007]MDA2761741.1 hypothetical protein [Bacillus cereus group sp. Bc008]
MNETTQKFYERIQEELNLKDIKEAQKVYRFYSSLKGMTKIVSEEELQKLLKMALNGEALISEDRRFKG